MVPDRICVTPISNIYFNYIVIYLFLSVIYLTYTLYVFNKNFLIFLLKGMRVTQTPGSSRNLYIGTGILRKRRIPSGKT